MKTSEPILVSTLAELEDIAKSSRSKADGRIILVPVDFSAYSEAALVYAASLAELLPAALIVMHVIHDPGETPGYYSDLLEEKQVSRIQNVAEQAFSEYLLRVRDAHPDCSSLQEVDSFMVTGLPVTRILEAVGELDPVMVVMGSQGRTGLDSLIIGSKAAQVVQLCPVPVTIVKHKEDSLDE